MGLGLKMSLIQYVTEMRWGLTVSMILGYVTAGVGCDYVNAT